MKLGELVWGWIIENSNNRGSYNTGFTVCVKHILQNVNDSHYILIFPFNPCR